MIIFVVNTLFFSVVQKTVNQEDWREAMSALASGVTIIACLDADKQPQGMTVSALCSLSMEPPMLLACINQDAPTYPHVLASGYFSVNILPAHQEELSNKFAVVPDEERFTNVSYVSALSGSPLIEDTLVAIDCKLEEKITAGDHGILFGRPVEIRFGSNSAAPLVYWRRGYRGII